MCVCTYMYVFYSRLCHSFMLYNYVYLHVCMYLHVCVLLQIMAQFNVIYLCISTCMYVPACMCFIADYGTVLWFKFMCIYMYVCTYMCVFYYRLWHSFMVHIYVDKIKVITREGRILILSYEEKELEDFIMWQVNVKQNIYIRYSK